MIYDKLPIVFLSTMASEQQGTTNSLIASYILEHLDELKDTGIKDLANATHVGTGSISRFCREIGLRDFAELKELIANTQLSFEHGGFSDIVTEYEKQVNNSISQVADTVSMDMVRQLCEEIRKYDKVAAFGLLKAGSVAMNLQVDLLMQGKQIYTNISYKEQLDYMLEAGKDDLIIIFSYTGSYFEYAKLRDKEQLLHKPKIWFNGAKQKSYPAFVNKVISFDSHQDQASHPYQLQFVEGLIAQCYGDMNNES